MLLRHLSFGLVIASSCSPASTAGVDPAGCSPAFESSVRDRER
jgi:hypothetical protein